MIEILTQVLVTAKLKLSINAIEHLTMKYTAVKMKYTVVKMKYTTVKMKYTAVKMKYTTV